MFRALLCSSSGGKNYYTASGIVTLCRWPYGAQVERGPPDGHLQSVTIPDAV